MTKLRNNTTGEPTILPVLNDGREDPGTSWNPDWHELLHSPDSVARQAAEKHGGLLAMNPHGRQVPQTIDAITKLREDVAANPDDERLRLLANVSQFVTAASKFRSQGYWFGIYVGGTNWFELLPNENPEQYAIRCEALIMPYLCVYPRINWLGFDRMIGTEDSELFLRRLRRNYPEIDLALEPGVLVSAPKEYRRCRTTFREKFFDTNKDDWSVQEGRLLEPNRPIRYVTGIDDMSAEGIKSRVKLIHSAGHIAAVPLVRLPEDL